MKRRFAILGCMLAASGAGAGPVCVAPDAAIPDDRVDGVRVPIEVVLPSGSVVDGVSVGLEIDHPWVGDVVVTLESPGGVTVVLLDRPGIPGTGGVGGFPGPFGCGGAGIAAEFTDSGAGPAEDACTPTGAPVIAGAVRPDEALGSLAGAEASGVWVLTVSDRSAYDAGVVRRVCLEIASSRACSADLAAPFGALNFFDISAFIGLFNAGDLGADFAAPFGSLNFFDVAAYIGAFNAGCP